MERDLSTDPIARTWQERRSGVRAGDSLVLRGERWRVLRALVHSDCEELDLEGNCDGNRLSRRAFLYPFDRPRPLARAGAARAVRRARWTLSCRALLIGATPFDRLRAAAAARVDLLPYQFEPALAAINAGRLRILLADEVGLGKTIQAGLILAELRARSSADRVLILSPAGLRHQWAHELNHRFGLEVSIVDTASLRQRSATLPRGVNPWMVPGIHIASLDFVKRPEVLRSLEAIVWDALVIDEAHSAVGATDRGDAARALGARARRVLLLTATPHAGDEHAFTSLCGIGACAGFPSPPILMFRRFRENVGLSRRRHARVRRVLPTTEERRVHHVLAEYTRAVWRQAALDDRRDALLAMLVLNKRALSSAASLARSVAHRLEAISIRPSASTPLQLPLADAMDETDHADCEPVGLLLAPGLAQPARERAWLGALLEASRAAAARESKLLALKRLLARTSEPVVVFTEYRDTLAHIARAVEACASVVTLHGGLAPGERRLAEEMFVSGSARVLVATDAAGEGLNLHARCRWVVNYELPWNPMRLEQRIGRVDRLGQRRTVHATHLVANDTHETRVLVRLLERLDRARAALGRVENPLGNLSPFEWSHGDGELAELSEEIVGRAVLTGEGVDAIFRSVDSHGSDDGQLRATRNGDPAAAACVAADEGGRLPAQEEAGRLQFVRSLMSRHGSRPRPCRSMDEVLARLESSGPWITTLKRRPALPAGLLYVFRFCAVDAAGVPVETILVPLHVGSPSLPARPSRHSAREYVQNHWRDFGSQLRALASREAATRLTVVRRSRATGILPRRDRELAIAESRRQSLTHRLVQPGLFERRSIREAEQTARLSEAADAEAQAAVAALDASLDVVLGEAELMLIAIVGK